MRPGAQGYPQICRSKVGTHERHMPVPPPYGADAIHMSFRGRLTLFFLLIVVLPMVALAVLVTQIVTESTNGKADARLAEGLDSALTLYRDDAVKARDAAKQVAEDPRLRTAIAGGRSAQAPGIANDLVGEHGIRAIAVEGPNGESVASAGAPVLVAPYRLTLNGPGGEIGSITVSATTPSGYLASVHHLTGRDAALLEPGGVSASTVGVSGSKLPSSGHSADVEVGGETLRAATTRLPPPANLRLVLFAPRESGGFFSSSPLVIGALVVFFAIAFLFVLTLLRMLSGQVRSMLEAARSIGEGDFSTRVPVVGRDEMAGLASEFNKMSDRLGDQMEELRRQKVEIDRSVRRIGQAFASGLDRQGLLRIVVETALGACRAKYGTIALRGTQGAEADAGTASKPIRDLVVRAERDAMKEDGLVVRRRDGVHALAAPLHRLGEQSESVGVMTVARDGEEFTPGERDVFLYLIGQMAASIENIALHELVSEQAVTDELTGLSNQRRFREQIAREDERAQRFRHDLSLIMLDIDDFKQVNDEHGHLQGDEVLRMVGRVLDEESRGVDEPARYGGEEFAVALPETDLAGAVEVAERIRSRIESERVPNIDGAVPLRVTASVGAASMPASASSVQELIAAADAALYEAKRAGKNRVVTSSAGTRAGQS
jgi:diguanylate cyclase (GGDEF)-like protein